MSHRNAPLSETGRLRHPTPEFTNIASWAPPAKACLMSTAALGDELLPSPRRIDPAVQNIGDARDLGVLAFRWLRQLVRACSLGRPLAMVMPSR